MSVGMGWEHWFQESILHMTTLHALSLQTGLGCLQLQTGLRSLPLQAGPLSKLPPGGRLALGLGIVVLGAIVLAKVLDRSYVRTVLGAVGTAGLAFAAVYVFRPGILPEASRLAIDRILSEADPLVVMGIVIAMSALIALTRFFNPTPPERGREADPPELPITRVETPGTTFDRGLAEDADVFDPSALEGEEARGGSTRARLRSVARRRFEMGTERSEAEAERLVRTGAWTADRTAAAFLGEPGESPNYPLLERFRGWVAPEAAYHRRARRTVAALAAEVEGVSAPSEPGGAGPGVGANLEQVLETDRHAAGGSEGAGEGEHAD
ncbi:MAG: hypothetical protein ABEJ71_03770 [Halodesulfurarchaeum sp.]